MVCTVNIMCLLFGAIIMVADLPHSDSDYSPFRSKLQALAFMLVHSPRPMVNSHNNTDYYTSST